MTTLGAHSPSRSAAALIEFATADCYRTNAFRLLALPVDADQLTIDRRHNLVARAFSAGLAAPPGPAPILPRKPAPDAYELGAAAHALMDAPQRLAHEVFWFWPAAPGQADPALTLMAEGRVEDACRSWRGAQAASAVARHNLAVFHHNAALEIEEARRAARAGAKPGRAASASGLARVTDAELDRHWDAAIEHWAVAAGSKDFWDLVRERIEAIGDPSLRVGGMDELRAALSVAIVKISARLAVGEAEQGAPARAQGHIARISKPGIPKANVEEGVRLAADPVRGLLKTLRTAAENEAKADPARSDAVIERFVQSARKSLATLALVFPPPNQVSDAEHDQVADACVSLIGAYAVKTKNWKRARALVSLADGIARNASSRERLAKLRQALDENIEDSVCWFCGVNEAHSPSAVSVQMFGDVTHSFGGRVTWRQATLAIPRCEPCVKREGAAGMTGCLGVLVSIGLAIGAWSAVDAASGGTAEFPVQAGAAALGLIVIGPVLIKSIAWMWTPKLADGAPKNLRAANDHPLVRERLRAGWQFGEKPEGVS